MNTNLILLGSIFLAGVVPCAVIMAGGAIAWVIIRNSRPQTIKVVACPACRNSVSEQANRCPHCGQPLRRWARGIYAVKLVAMLIIVGLLLWLVAGVACSVYSSHLDMSGHYVH